MHHLIAFATHWGSKYGGINSFNEDFLSAFASAYQKNVVVICIVAEASPEEIRESKNRGVTLLALRNIRQSAPFDDGHALCAIAVTGSRTASGVRAAGGGQVQV